jgi:phospholipase/lecithinase/hemolysin
MGSATDSDTSDQFKMRVQEWNDLLQERVSDLGAESTPVTVFLFSTHSILTKILDEPADFDFGPDDPTIEGGDIWADGLHLTEEVHTIFAERLLSSFIGSPKLS